MRHSGYVELVGSAQHGDIDAFSGLVAEFQDVVMGLAYGWLGDVEASRDVSQEVFLDAYVHLSQLRDPVAFPAWLRRIVQKHCDRVTRRPRPETAPLEAGAWLAARPDERDISATDAERRLRAAVSGLPAAERMVVALHYFAGLSGPELAAFLDLSLPTIKKRLRSARGRIRDQGDELMEKTLGPLRPSSTRRFADEVAFFLAIRAGDRARVAVMLSEAPELVNAVQAWDPGLVLDGVLPFANRATALITAIERDDLTLLEQLLDAGADVDGVCGCVTGESPIWAATVLERLRHLTVLLARGGDPNRRSGNGNTALHVAAMRGARATAELLLAHGADPHACDRGDRTPTDWARINGHCALADLLEGRARSPGVRAHGRYPDIDSAEPSQQSSASSGISVPQQHDEPAAVWLTGIKALDLFCPLPRQGLVRIPFMAGAGMVVLVGELCRRILRSPTGRALWTGFSQRPFDLQDWETDIAELGLAGRVERSLADLEASPEARRDAFLRGLDRAEAMTEAGLHVLLVLMSEPAFESDLESSFPRVTASRGAGSLTALHLTAFPEQNDATLPAIRPPYSAQIKFQRAIARRGIYPALDPQLCLSRASMDVGEYHAEVAGRARATLTDYLTRDPELAAFAPGEAAADPHLAGMDAGRASGADERDAPALRLIRYLAQPFYVTEPFTGRPGTWIDRAELLDSVQAILNGRPDPL